MLCETSFSGGGELSPGGPDEFFWTLVQNSCRRGMPALYNAARLVTTALVDDRVKYGIAEQEDFPPTILVSQLNRSSGPASDIVVPTYYPSRFYSREWCMGRYGQNGGLKLDNPTETTDFSLAYFRSDTSTGLLTVGPSQLALLEVQV